jgi:hypothetical protein
LGAPALPDARDGPNRICVQSINAQPVFSGQFHQLPSGFNGSCCRMKNGIGKKIPAELGTFNPGSVTDG